jgi:2-keto-myo-inositol isomerase
MTGIVHISGVVDGMLSPEQMKDSHRVLIDGKDFLGNVQQIRSLTALGYAGACSYEPFSPSVQSDPQVEKNLLASIRHIETALTGQS